MRSSKGGVPRQGQHFVYAEDVDGHVIELLDATVEECGQLTRAGRVPHSAEAVSVCSYVAASRGRLRLALACGDGPSRDAADVGVPGGQLPVVIAPPRRAYARTAVQRSPPGRHGI